MLQLTEEYHFMDFEEEGQCNYCQQTIHDEEDLQVMLEKMNFDCQKQNYYKMYSASSEKYMRQTDAQSNQSNVALFTTQRKRKVFNIQIQTNHKEVLGQLYHIKYRALKRWGSIIKNLFKSVESNRFTLKQIQLIQQYCFTLGNSLPSIRKLLGFERNYQNSSKQFTQIVDCQLIRQFLLSQIDNYKICRVIDKIRICKQYRLQLIQSIKTVRQLILNPTIQLMLKE